MTYTIEKHPTLPALICTWHDDFEFARDAREMSAAMGEALDQQTSPVFYVLDVSSWHNMPFDELIEATSIAARRKGANFHHAMNQGNLIITNETAVRMSAEGLRSDAFGNANVMVFETLEDALAVVKAHAV